MHFEIVRPKVVTLRGLDLDGNEVVIEGDEVLARLFQHEIDHLDGVLLLDRLEPDERKHALRAIREQDLATIPRGARPGSLIAARRTVRLVFLGTPDDAVPPLRALVDAGHDVVLVVTQPDRRRGRGRRRRPEPGEAGRDRARACRCCTPERAREASTDVAATRGASSASWSRSVNSSRPRSSTRCRTDS